MSLRLYEIADQYQFILRDLYDEETGEISENTIAKLQELGDSLETKCINITRIFKQIDAEREAIEKERKAMAAREKSLKNQVDRLKDYLLSNMERCEIKKIECPQFVISLQKNPPSVDTYDESVIPEEYKKVTISFDLQKMKEDISKKGIAIPGVRLLQRSSLRIR